jgi:hypothetical protein
VAGENIVERKATCHCGRLEVVTTCDPVRVVVCHCEDCQRRTGSSYNLGAVFEPADVTSGGKSTIYHRTGELGIRIEFHFCPVCGSNVYWHFDDMLVVAAGCYADPSFPAPSVSLYGKNRNHWLPHLEVAAAYSSNRDSELEDVD